MLIINDIYTYAYEASGRVITSSSWTPSVSDKYVTDWKHGGGPYIVHPVVKYFVVSGGYPKVLMCMLFRLQSV